MPLNISFGAISARGYGFGGNTYKPGSTTYSTVGTYAFTVPSSVLSLTVIVCAGGGGGGGIDGGNASQGRGGKILTFTQTVAPGTIYRIGVGGGGGGGTNLSTPAPGGSGGTTASYSGIPNFTGGTGGDGYSSGGGAGGGAASWFATAAASLIAVAGGGAGGGGSGRFSGPPGYATGYNTSSVGANGQNYSGDMGGGGGGGGGYTYGGAGGTTPGGDNGAYGGNDGQSLVPSGASQSTASNYGGTGTAGTAGYVTISW
jgi:hypothetical protein